MSGWWTIPVWAGLGAAVGAALGRPTRRLLATHGQQHPLGWTAALAAATAVLFGLLAWRIGPRPDLLADSALAAVCVPRVNYEIC